MKVLKLLVKTYANWCATLNSTMIRNKVRNIIDNNIDNDTVTKTTCQLAWAESGSQKDVWCARRRVDKKQPAGLILSTCLACTHLQQSEYHLGTIQNRHARSHHFRLIKLASTYTPSSYPTHYNQCQKVYF